MLRPVRRHFHLEYDSDQASGVIIGTTGQPLHHPYGPAVPSRGRNCLSGRSLRRRRFPRYSVRRIRAGRKPNAFAPRPDLVSRVSGGFGREVAVIGPAVLVLHREPIFNPATGGRNRRAWRGSPGDGPRLGRRGRRIPPESRSCDRDTCRCPEACRCPGPDGYAGSDRET